MEIKTKVSQQVKKIVDEGKSIDENIVNFIKKDFHHTLTDCKKMEHSVKQATADTLEGVYSGLKSAGYATENIIAKSASALIDITCDMAEQTIGATRSYADDAKLIFDDAIEKSTDSLGELGDKTKAKMEAAHTLLLAKTTEEKQKLADVAEGILTSAKSKKITLAEATQQSLQHSADQAKIHIQAITKTSEVHSKQLLHHSRAKVADWLGKLKDKVEP